VSVPPPDRISPGRPARAIGSAIHRRLAAVAPSARREGLEEARTRLATFVRAAAGRRLFLAYWLEDVLPLMLYGCLGDKVVEGPLRFVCDDTAGGKITAEILTRMGQSHAPLRLGNDAVRVRDVQRLIVEPSVIGIAVDGRGPYRLVGRESARLVQRCDAVVLPLAIRVDRAWTIWPRPRIRLPRPRTSLVVVAGDPVEPGRDLDALRARMQSALETAGRSADALLWHGAPQTPSHGV